MKKFVKLLVCVVMMTCVFSFFTGCNPEKLEKITGIYELTEQTRQANDEEEATDEKARDGIISYIILDGTDYPTYVYKTNTQKTVCKQLYAEYKMDDDGEKVRQIAFSDGMDNGTKFTLYVDKQSEGMCLRKTQLHIAKVNYSTTVKYERISESTDLSVVSEKMGESLACIPYEWVPYHGFSIVCYNQIEPVFSDPNIYYIVDINGITKKATVYWCYKSDPDEPQTKTVDVSLTETTLTIGNDTYTRSGNNGYCFQTSTLQYEEEEIELLSMVTRYYADSMDEYMETAVTNYKNSLPKE